MPPVHPRYLSAASTDRGFVRSENEDRVYCDDARGFFLVADGIGGHEAGAQAAEIGVEKIRNRLERQTDTSVQRLREAITLANNAIFEKAQETPAWKGMACVATVAVVENGHVTVGHVGDSRLYKIQGGSIAKITRDHSPVGEREDSGELTEAEAMQHPRRNEVYRDVGSEEHRPDDDDFVEIFTFDFEPDSAFLLCSDGLTDAIPSGRILEIVEQNAGDRWAAVRALIEAATGIGEDNVSVVLVEGEDFAVSLGRPVIDSREAAESSDTSAINETARLPPVATIAPGPSAHWYRSALAYVLYGCLLGAALAFAVQVFLSQRSAATVSKVLQVSAPGTISEAIARAHAGDIIYVAAGRYAENVKLTEGVALVAQPDQKAIIQGSVTADEVKHARLEGFQIRGNEIGIRINNSDVLLLRDDVSESRLAGVEFRGRSRGAVFACDIHHNAGPGIVLSSASSPVIENNLVLANGLQGSPPRPGILVRSILLPLVVRNNIIAANGAEPIWLPAADEALVQQNSFNFAGKGEERPKFRIISPQEGAP